MIITVHVKPHTNSLAIVVYPSPLGPRLRATNGGSGLGEKGSRFRCLLVYSHKLTNPWTIVNYPSCKEARISMMSTTWLEIRKDNWIHPWSKLSERWEEEPRTALLALTQNLWLVHNQKKTKHEISQEKNWALLQSIELETKTLWAKFDYRVIRKGLLKLKTIFSVCMESDG